MMSHIFFQYQFLYCISFCLLLICERSSVINVSSFIPLLRNLLRGSGLKASCENIRRANLHLVVVGVFVEQHSFFFLQHIYIRSSSLSKPVNTFIVHMTLVFSFVINDEAVFHSLSSFHLTQFLQHLVAHIICNQLFSFLNTP